MARRKNLPQRRFTTTIKMSLLQGKKVLLAISGGIAAYKTTFLVRLFIKAGAEVQVLMTPAAKDFVTPLSLSALSGKEVFSELINQEHQNPTWNNHVDFSLWADFMIIAPATANTLAKMAHGECDNLVLATFLSAKCPVYIAPAMDLDMYQHPATQHNLNALAKNNVKIIPAESGFLASGLTGEGRMAEPENIIQFIEKDLIVRMPLYQKKVLITAGPTYEPIDPVRFIGNHSSGKTGYALAEQAYKLGADVTLISGPTSLNIAHHGINVIKVTTSDQMYEACLAAFDKQDIVIMAAAVADYKPIQIAQQKIKKSDNEWHIALTKTKDILKTLGEQKKDQLLVGFALETQNEIDNAYNKVIQKNLDFIVLNSLNDPGAGFGADTNKITLIDKQKNITAFELKSKNEVAKDILKHLIANSKL